MIVHHHTVGDTLTPIGFQLRRQDANGDWEYTDLTDKVVKFRMVDEDGTVIVDDSATGITITDAETGKGQYDFQAADVEAAGVFYAWVRVYDGTEVDTYPAGGRQLMIIMSGAV